MKRQHAFILGLFVVVLLTSLMGCGSSSPPSQNKLTFSTYNLSGSGSGISALMNTAGPGSELTSFQVKITKLELISDSGSYVVYEGDGRYIETVGLGFSGSLQFDRPPARIYTGYRMTGGGMRVKAKIRIGGDLYYTANQTVDPAAPGYHWPMTISQAEWGHITVENIPEQLVQIEGRFPTPLVVPDNDPVDLRLIWLFDRDYDVINYDGADQDHITYITALDKVSAIVPYKPAKRIDITLTATKAGAPDRTNIITLFFDANGSLVGVYCQRPANEAFAATSLGKGRLAM